MPTLCLGPGFRPGLDLDCFLLGSGMIVAVLSTVYSVAVLTCSDYSQADLVWIKHRGGSQGSEAGGQGGQHKSGLASTFWMVYK